MSDEDDDDMAVCEACDARVPFETMTSHGGGVYLCAACTDAAAAEFHACDHRWEDGEFTEHGEPAKFCTRCSGLIDHEWAMSLFPFICDGWVEESAA